MKRQLIRSNIVDVQADALIYSTNIQLLLTGGVGAALLTRFGPRIQDALGAAAGRPTAEVGEVFETTLSGIPWKVIFHTVATDKLYYTRPEIVLAILRKCFRRCVELQSIKSIITSSLGCGYGDLDVEQFLRIADQVCAEFDESSIENFAIVCRSGEYFEHLRKAARTVHDNWDLQG